MVWYVKFRKTAKWYKNEPPIKSRAVAVVTVPVQTELFVPTPESLSCAASAISTHEIRT